MVNGLFLFLKMVGGRCFNHQYIADGRWIMVGGRWSVFGSRWFCTTPQMCSVSNSIFKSAESGNDVTAKFSLA